jgi:hypothetical protein
LIAIERERLEDLVAEGRTRYETARLRAACVAARDVRDESTSAGYPPVAQAQEPGQIRLQHDAPKRDRAA